MLVQKANAFQAFNLPLSRLMKILREDWLLRFEGGGWNQGGQGGYNSGGNWSNDNFGGGYQQGYGGGPVRNNFNSGGRPAPYGINSGPSGRQSGDSRWLPPFGGQGCYYSCSENH